MDPQNQLGFGWLLAPTTGAGNGILFCNADHQGVTTVTTVPAPVVMTMDSNRVNKVLDGSTIHTQQFQSCGGGGVPMIPIKYEVLPKNISNHNNHLQGGVPVTVSVPLMQHPPSSSSVVASTVQRTASSTNCNNGEAHRDESGGGSRSQTKSSNKNSLDEDELARRREINRVREKRRREQMTPKERAKARKKNRLRARKRRRNMTPEEREMEKERNRERARQRRAQKLQQQQEQGIQHQ